MIMVLSHQAMHDQQGTRDNSVIDLIQNGTSESSSNLVDWVESETVIVTKSEETGSVGENGDSNAKANVLEMSKIGCSCKDELRIAHQHCTEAWFMLKGNR
ncbi:hypothetical protein HHK36_021186 [Tetracentron sinense]|uniref:RING-CH-type domain-containing protein n=1 Tax=Tetracentron sinense TaxID=13715 RepID=A0A834YWG5_TETSI|nr:hypothetical protein HHK36_021186 [Tetracentron sinense]